MSSTRQKSMCRKKLILCFLAIFALAVSPAFAAQTWITWNISFESGTLKTIVPNALTGQQSRIEWLIEMADRSTVTTNPLGENPDGWIKPGDVVLVSNSLLMWFDVTSDQLVTWNGGGGMLRGVWPLHIDGSGNLNFRRIINTYNYSPNMFFPGSDPGRQGSGVTYGGNWGIENIDSGITWGIEHEASPNITGLTGVSISEIDQGKYWDQDGVFVQFNGYLANSYTDQGTLESMGIDSHYDTDTRLGLEGRAFYTLTHRIPATGDEWRMEIDVNVTQNNFGAMPTMIISNNLGGYEGVDIKYVSDPALCGDIVWDSTQWFTLPGYNLRFYTHSWTGEGSGVTWSETTHGVGRLIGMGVPQISYPVGFLAFRTDTIPEEFQSTYVLQAIDNWQAGIGTRVNAYDLQFFDTNRGHLPRTFGPGAQILTIFDYGIHGNHGS